MSLHIAHVTPAYFPGTTHHGVCLIGTPTLKKQFNFIMCADNGDADCYKLDSGFVDNCYILGN